MLGPVSKTLGIWCLGYAALNAYARAGSAVSEEAQEIGHTAAALARSVENSVTLFGEKAAALSRLRAMANECAEANWDGEYAKPLDPMAARYAEDLVRAMPEEIPMPEFAPEPDGSLSLDWIQSRNRLFSLSVGASNRLAYAWLDGTDRGHGVARFDGLSVPPRVLDGIQSILEHSHASLRAA